jgi:CopG family nickel-responsive transcriptional regulator
LARIIRVGVTFPPRLLNDLDEVIAKTGYANRSKAVQDAVTMLISEKKLIGRRRGAQAGVLMMLYDHEVKGLESVLTHVQHLHSDIICSTMHIHLTEKECLETIAVKGNGADIRKLSDELSTRKGVKLLRTMVISV